MPHQFRAVHVAVGSKADVTLLNHNVRFTPESRHQNWPRAIKSILTATSQVASRHRSNPPHLIFGEQLGEGEPLKLCFELQLRLVFDAIITGQAADQLAPLPVEDASHGCVR